MNKISNNGFAKIAEALNDNLTSPNEPDRNFENANVVDGLFAIARALRFVAKAILVTSNMDMVALRARLAEHFDLFQDRTSK